MSAHRKEVAGTTAIGLGAETPKALDSAPGREHVIYAITNLRTGKRYIGRSVNYELRWYAHRSALLQNKHWCMEMQSDWNLDGNSGFSFSVLERRIFSTKDAKAAEIRHISATDCYNHLIIVDHETGSLSLTPLLRKRQSEALKRAWNDPNSNLRNPVRTQWDAPGAREKHSMRMRDRYTDPAERLRTAELTRAGMTPEVRALKSAKAKASWADPNSRQRTTNRTQSQETRDKTAEQMRQFWASPEGRVIQERRGERLRELWNNPAGKLRNRKRPK